MGNLNGLEEHIMCSCGKVWNRSDDDKTKHVCCLNAFDEFFGRDYSYRLERDKPQVKATVDIYEGDRVVRAKQTEFMKEHEVWKPKESFVKVYDTGIDSILDNLTDADACRLTGMDCKILLKLIRYISYESGMLTKTGKNDSRYALTNEDIINYTGIRKQTVIKTMQNLVDLSILSRNRYGRCYQYYANPYIFFRGTYINKMLKDMFKKYASSNGL